MTQQTPIAPVAELKAQARRLRERLQESGLKVSHSKGLELIARQYGARDWNTLCAMAGRRVALQVGDAVQGHYLGQSFTGRVRSLTQIGDGSHRRITVQFDQAVDVVRFASFSAFRQRVSAVVGWDGRSTRCTSDGEPQMVIRPC